MSTEAAEASTEVYGFEAGCCEGSRTKKCDKQPDAVNHPPHYLNHPSGIECITDTESMGFCLGNAVKYIWRADLKDNATQDLEKAIWYLKREIKRRSSTDGRTAAPGCPTTDT